MKRLTKAYNHLIRKPSPYHKSVTAPLYEFGCREYVEQVRESASLLLSTLGHLENCVKTMKYVHNEPFRTRCVEVITRIANEIKPIVASVEGQVYPKSLEQASVLDKTTNQAKDILEYVTTAIDQRLEGHIFEQSSYGTLVKSEFVANRVHTAIDNLMGYFMKAYLQAEIAEAISIVTVFGHQTDYQARLIPWKLPLIALVHIPKTDLYRCRYWASLAHETVHLHWFSARALVGLPKATESKIDKLTSKIQKVGITVFGIDAPDLARSQLEEILCDLNSVALVGMADLLTILTSCCSFNDGIGKYEDHPPWLVRTKYMMKYLEKECMSKHPASLELYDDLFEDCKKSWHTDFERAITQEGTAGKKPDNQKMMKYFEEYQSFIDGNFQDLVSVSNQSLFIDSSDCFSPRKWERIIEAYKKYKEGAILDGLNLDPVDVLNLVWLKRFEICRQTPKEMLSKNYTIWRKSERKLFNDIVDLLARKGW